MEQQQHMFSNRLICSLLIPVVLEQLLNSIMGTADTMMVSNVGSAAISAVSLVDSINVLVIQAFSALAAGGAIVCAQYIGQKNKEKANESARQVLFIITAISVAVSLICLVFQKPLLRLIFGSVEPAVMSASETYFFYTALSFPFIAAYDSAASIFRAQDNTKGPMIISMISNVMNIAGNAVMIWVFHMGVAGAALSTLISRIFCAVVVIIQLRKEREGQEIVVRDYFKIRPDWSMIRRILGLGIPSGVENSMFQLGKILLLSLISTFGTASIAANAVSNSLAYFEILPGMALGLATVTVISRCVGAGDYPQAEYFAKRLLKFTYTCMWITCIVMMLLLPFMLKIYNLSPETSGYATQIMILHSIMAMIFWPAAFALPNVFRAANDVRFTMVVGVTSMWLFRIACAFIFGKYMGFGVFGAWIAMVLDWVVRAIFYVIHYRCGKWKEKSL